MRFAVFLACFALAAACPNLFGQKALHKELSSGYLRWQLEDVAYIITDDERKSFNQLGTDEEREQFIEQFWLRRDPTPDTIENEYKEEHYRRLAYANQHFASGIPGWKTDRGRMYIRFGPPDEIDSHPSGGTYQRPVSEGGGQTSTYPFEQWRYRHLENVGEDIVIEFVDNTMTGEYRMTTDPCQKDALTHIAGGSAPCGTVPAGQVAGQNQFDRLEIQSNLEKAPAVKFTDLEALVTSHTSFNLLPLAVRIDYLRITDFSVMTNVTVQFENRDLQFALADGVQKSEIDLLGHIYTMTRRPAATFEKAIAIVCPPAMLAQVAGQRSVYQQSIPLGPGRYRLNIVARDVVSKSIGQYEVALEVPRFEEGVPALSGLILADTIEPTPTKNIGGAMFSIGDTKVRPRVGNQFESAEKMGIYLQVYNFKPESVTYRIYGARTSDTTLTVTENLSLPVIEKLLPLKGFQPGEYVLAVSVSGNGQTLEQTAHFAVRN